VFGDICVDIDSIVVIESLLIPSVFYNSVLNTDNMFVLLEPAINGLGFELVDVECVSHLIRVFIDKVQDGQTVITVDDCALVSSHISRLLQVEQIDYGRLEVSSPGVERALKKMSDFLRFVGHTIKIKTTEAVNDRSVFIGKILGAQGDAVVIECDGIEVCVDFKCINKARLVLLRKV
jgi:ribosome maturation factor RimP